MKRVFAAAAVLLIGTAAYAGETINGKPVAMGAAGIPYVVGGTDQENWLARRYQQLEDKVILDGHDWSELPNLGDRYTWPSYATVPVIVVIP